MEERVTPRYHPRSSNALPVVATACRFARSYSCRRHLFCIAATRFPYLDLQALPQSSTAHPQPTRPANSHPSPSLPPQITHHRARIIKDKNRPFPLVHPSNSSHHLSSILILSSINLSHPFFVKLPSSPPLFPLPLRFSPRPPPLISSFSPSYLVDSRGTGVRLKPLHSPIIPSRIERIFERHSSCC